jgi:hypothetical protein
VRAGDERVLAKAHAAAAVAAEVAQHGAGLEGVAGCAALGGAGGDLVFLARHLEYSFSRSGDSGLKRLVVFAPAVMWLRRS